MSTWEERMAARAAKRREIARAEEEQERQWEEANGPHAGHHEHLDGSSVYCSCGEFFGVTSVSIAIPGTAEEWDAYVASLACGVCGKRGVVGLES